MTQQGSVRISTDLTRSNKEWHRSAGQPLEIGGNAHFDVVEFDKVIGKMVDEARAAIVAEFGEPKGYQNPRLTEESRKEVGERLQEHKLRFRELEEEVERLKKQLSVRTEPATPPVVAGGGTANEWFQKISSALGVGPGGVNVKLKDAATAIEILQERSTTLREIEEIHKKRMPWTRDFVINGKVI